MTMTVKFAASLAVTGGVLATVALASPAAAAPQILAALQTWDGVEFHCADGLCKADLTTYCLQKNRPAPGIGQAYVPAVPEAFSLVVTRQDGSEVTLPANEHLNFVESRGFMAVSGMIAETALAALTQGGTAKLTVSQNASLLPVPDPSDKNPLTDAEIAHATTSLRTIGEQVVDTSVKGQAARMLAHLRSKLPTDAKLPKAASEVFWRDSIGDELPASLPTGTMKLVQERYEGCFTEVDNLRFSDMGRCLEYRQDNLIRELNIDYWQQQPGS